MFEYKVFAAYAAAPEDILKQHDCYDFDAFSSYVQEILSQRSMSAVTDPSMQDQILGTWCMLTLEATTSYGEDYLVQATATGAGSAE